MTTNKKHSLDSMNENDANSIQFAYQFDQNIKRRKVSTGRKEAIIAGIGTGCDQRIPDGSQSPKITLPKQAFLSQSQMSQYESSQVPMAQNESSREIQKLSDKVGFNEADLQAFVNDCTFDQEIKSTINATQVAVNENKMCKMMAEESKVVTSMKLRKNDKGKQKFYVSIIPRNEEWWLERLGHSWFDALKEECQQTYLLECLSRVELERKNKNIYPPDPLIFNAFRRTPLTSVEVVIVGQDPYYRPHQAMGLSFSVPKGIKVPASLINIYKEIDKNKKPPHGDLSEWADQGVFLLNALLTVEEGKPLSHRSFGWAQFTDKVINILSQQEKRIIFLLWGLPAKKKGISVDRSRHIVLEAGHPSPLSIKQFSGCDHFEKANQVLKDMNRKSIHWQLK